MDYMKRNVDDRIKESRECESYIYKLDNIKLNCHKDVFSPKHHYTTEVILEKFPYKKNEKVLEMGCALMALGLKMARDYNCNVSGCDINPKAVELANKNIIDNNLSDNAEAFQSNLFSNVKDKYDTIIWDFPFIIRDFDENNMHQRAFFSKDYNILEKFLREVFNYLTKDGRVILITGKMGSNSKLDVVLKKHELSKKLLSKGTTRKDNLATIIYEIY